MSTAHRSRTLVIAAAFAAVAGFLAIYVQLPPAGNSVAPEGKAPPAAIGPAPFDARLAGLNRGHMATFLFKTDGATPAAVAFTAADRRALSLSALKGKVLLVNLWATWCAPCRKEMPALDRLQAALGGADFEVVALNTERDGLQKGQRFFDEIGVKHLLLYADETAKAGSQLRAVGLPTTLLIGRDGREIGRLIGPAEWDSEDAERLIKAAIAAGA